MVSIPYAPARRQRTFPAVRRRRIPLLRFSENAPPVRSEHADAVRVPRSLCVKRKENGTAYAMPFLFYGFSAGAFVPFAVFGCFAALLLSPVTASAPSRMALPASSTASPTALPASSTPSRTSSPTVFVLVSRRSSTALLVPLLVPLPLSVPLSCCCCRSRRRTASSAPPAGDQLFFIAVPPNLFSLV